MNERELAALEHAAAGELAYHTGRWGGPAGYRWRGSDGAESGILPQSESLVLDGLAGHGLIATERSLGPLPRKVLLTPIGLAVLAGRRQAA